MEECGTRTPKMILANYWVFHLCCFGNICISSVFYTKDRLFCQTYKYNSVWVSCPYWSNIICLWSRRHLYTHTHALYHCCV